MDYQRKSQQIIAWIKKTFAASGLQKIIIGMSGGIDSSLSAVLVVKAVGKDRVIPVLMPYGSMSEEALADARVMIDFLGIHQKQVMTIDIQKGVDAISQTLPLTLDPSPSGRGEDELYAIRIGNIMARVRMITLFDIAKRFKGLVCGTENKSEHYLGYYTRFGDEASDMEPIRSLYKTQVWEMARSLGLPEKIITKAPTAGLWQGQTDESELGFSYKDADTVLRYSIDGKLSEKEIVAKGLNPQLVKKVLKRVKAIEFKQRLPHVYG